MAPSAQLTAVARSGRKDFFHARYLVVHGRQCRS